MQDLILDVVTALVILTVAATFAAMIWAARQVDGRSHGPVHLQLPHLPHVHLRRRP